MSRVRKGQEKNQGLVFGGGHRDKNENVAHSASSPTRSVSFSRGAKQPERNIIHCVPSIHTNSLPLRESEPEYLSTVNTEQVGTVHIVCDCWLGYRLSGLKFALT